MLTIGISSGPLSLDPAHDAPGVGTLLHRLSNAAITDQSADGPVVGELATSYHYVGAGNRRFVFTLRHDARFSDGATVDARAVVTWLRYFIVARGPQVGTLGDVSSIRARGRWTVELSLGAPNPNLPQALSQAYDGGLVVSPKALADPAELARYSDGAGPYVLVPKATVANRRYTFVPNRYYYDKSAIRYRKVIVTVHGAGSMLRAVDSGAVEVASGNMVTASQAAFANLNVLHYPAEWSGLVFVYQPDAAPDPLADVRVRRALNYAMDRQSIAELAIGPDVGKYGAPGSTPAATHLWGAPTSEIPTVDAYNERYRGYYAYDPSRARRLLAAAGYPHGFTLYVTPLTGTPDGPLVFRTITADLAAIGITVTTTPTPDAAAAAVQVQQTTQPMSTLFDADFLPPTAPAVAADSSDAVLGRLWLRAQSMFPPAAGAAWNELSARLTTDAWALPLYELDSLYYVSSRVGGVVASAATGGPDPTTWFPTGVPQPHYQSIRQSA